mmetsp:Transcript_1303/g.2022  ORF Transcript_1303/g.2022 Transcript_1303/m.2022 type:complete len:212 (-) Transcript_1303:28-663(-)
MEHVPRDLYSGHLVQSVNLLHEELSKPGFYFRVLYVHDVLVDVKAELRCGLHVGTLNHRVFPAHISSCAMGFVLQTQKVAPEHFFLNLHQVRELLHLNRCVQAQVRSDFRQDELLLNLRHEHLLLQIGRIHVVVIDHVIVRRSGSDKLGRGISKQAHHCRLLSRSERLDVSKFILEKGHGRFIDVLGLESNADGQQGEHLIHPLVHLLVLI